MNEAVVRMVMSSGSRGWIGVTMKCGVQSRSTVWGAHAQAAGDACLTAVQSSSSGSFQPFSQLTESLQHTQFLQTKVNQRNNPHHHHLQLQIFSSH